MSAAPDAGWGSSLLRLQAVAFVLVRHGFGEVVARIGLGGLATPNDAGAASRERLGKRLARVLADLGPTWIKLGQLLATREDLFAPEITTALAELHAQVPPLRPRDVTRAVRAALGQSPDEAFAYFDPTPLAAASIGQVHRARLRTGEEVVVKVQRPGLRAVVRGDLALMRKLATLLVQAFPELAAYDPLALLGAFEQSLEAELDFRREAENAATLARLLDGAKEVRVPRVFLARPTLLVLELVNGAPLAKIAPSAKPRVRLALLRAFVRQILEHGVFHADPHPGNFLIEADGTVVLLDLGAVDRLDAKTRTSLARVVVAAALGRRRALAEAVLALAIRGPTPVDFVRLERELAAIVTATESGASGAELLQKMIAVSRAHGLRMPPSLLGLTRALAILDGVLRGLAPAANLVADLRRELAHALARFVFRRFVAMLVLMTAFAAAVRARAAALAVRARRRVGLRLPRAILRRFPRAFARSSLPSLP